MSPFLDVNDSDERHRETRLSDVFLFKALLPYMRAQWPSLVLTLVLLPCIALTQVAQPFILKRAIDGPIAQGNFLGLLQWTALFLGLLLLHYAFRYFQMQLAQRAGQRVVLSLRTDLYNHLQALPLQFYHRTPLGKLVTRISSDVENISEVFSSGSIAIIADIAIILGIFVGMFLMHRELALVVALMTPVVVLVMEFFRRRSRGAYDAIRVQSAQMNASLQESLSGMDIIRLLQREESSIQSFSDLGKTLMRTNVRSVVFDSAFTASVEVMTQVSILLVLGYFIWRQQGTFFSTETLTIGMLVAFLQYIQMLFEPVEELSDKFTIIQSGLASLEKIMDLMQTPLLIMNPAHPKPLTRAMGEIRFENVTFGYTPDRPVLHNVSFTIPPGEKVAFIGATGAGKSTIIKLLNRQYDPQGGRILLDGTDIREYALADLRRNIVLIPQEEFLFSRTIQDNITLAYTKQPDEAALRRVLQAVHADELVQRLPQGLQTVLPERGRSLSAGERQLLMFARALWHEPAVLVLDEATASIDPQTEALIQDALHTSLSGRTAIVIAHRLATIRETDTVYKIDNGQIVDFGPPTRFL